MDTQRNHILAKDAERNFFKHVKTFSSFEKPSQFDVRTILPDLKRDEDVVERLASYFNEVSREFEALAPDQIPSTSGRLGRFL